MSSKSLATHATHAKHDIVLDYRNLPEPLKKQLAKLQEKFEEDSEIKSVANDLYRKAYRQYNKTSLKSTTLNLKKIAFRMAMLRAIPSDTLLHSKWFPYVYAYDHRGHTVALEREIAQGRHVYVIAGKLDNEIPVVVKWYQSNRRDTLYEISIYKRLRKMGCETPWFSSSYRFWDFPVLVMEKLFSVTKDDDEFELSIQIIRQLTYLHQFGVHCDIKPQNIMIRRVEGKPKYLLIDHGGVATQKLQYGFRRFIWSPRYSLQRLHEANQVTTAKNDFLELGVCMKAIQNMRTGDKKVKSGFTGKLKKYMDRCELINDRDIKPQDYEDLIKILQE
jgi:hypothetical protein